MAATIAAIRKINRRKVEEDDDSDTENLLQKLTARLPPEETWDSEHFLGMLILGYDLFAYKSAHVRKSKWVLAIYLHTLFRFIMTEHGKRGESS
jgi:hypothetical protein